jgi:predicted nuclease of predicted toxin-antitoxin system
VLVTSDTDFGELLAKSGALLPSVIIFRGDQDDQDMRRFERLARLLVVLRQYSDDLRAGAVVIVEAGRVRSKRLPIGG